MKKIIDTLLKVVAFQRGSPFRFPDDEAVYRFWYIEYVKGRPVVWHYDENGNGRAKPGFYFSDLKRV